MKPANYAPVYAAALYPQWAEIAREHGYALAVHGSLARDFDLIAIPWRDDAKEPKVVVDEITTKFAAKLVGGPPSNKAHGRIAYTLSIGFGECFADLSFMPRMSALILDAADLRKLADAADRVTATPAPKRDHIAECSAASDSPATPKDHGCGRGAECWCEEGREIAACEERKEVQAAPGVPEDRAETVCDQPPMPEGGPR